MNNFLDTNFNLNIGLGVISISQIILIIIVCVFAYVLIYSFLQVRQIKVFQEKVKTSADPLLRIFGYAYFLIQVMIFLVVVGLVVA